MLLLDASLSLSLILPSPYSYAYSFAPALAVAASLYFLLSLKAIESHVLESFNLEVPNENISLLFIETKRTLLMVLKEPLFTRYSISPSLFDSSAFT
jgi:hypothetical protein